jgi:hypothetical protein
MLACMSSRRIACLVVTLAAAVAATPAFAAKSPETNASLGPETGAGHYLAGQSESGQWHGCRKSDVAWYPISLLTEQPTTTPSTHRYVTFTINPRTRPTFSWKVKSGYRICGVEAFATLSSPETKGGQLLAWASYKSGPTSGSTALDGKETVKVHMPKDLEVDDQPDLKIYEGKTLGMDAFQAIAVYVKKK